MFKEPAPELTIDGHKWTEPLLTRVVEVLSYAISEFVSFCEQNLKSFFTN